VIPVEKYDPDCVKIFKFGPELSPENWRGEENVVFQALS